MIFLLRIASLAVFVYYAKEVSVMQPVAPTGSLLQDLPLIGEFLFVALFNAVLWAPWFGEKLSATVTGSIVSHDSDADATYWSHRAIHWLRHHRFRRVALCWCVLEGLNRPWMPHPFAEGMKMAKKDSWLAAVFAREVYRFSNVYNCLEAYRILKRRGPKPGLHKLQEINLFIVESEKEVRPAREPLPAPDHVPDPPMKRDRRIELFDGEDEPEIEREPNAETGRAPGTESPAAR